MDVVRFGRWLADRRRDQGWPSQRALAGAACEHPRTSGLAISEAFLARLEAGLLVHPFRGTVRSRVVGLAWLLCSSPRQLRDYLKFAELSDLSRAEALELEDLRRSLSDSRPPRITILPPPPPCLVGRAEELATLTSALSRGRGSYIVITGMPGIGKTSLAVMAAHQLAEVHHREARFADGIIFITCTGRHGAPGAYAILEDVLALHAPSDHSVSAHSHSAATLERAPVGDAADAALACIVGHVRQSLAASDLLVLLDGVEPDLPLDPVLDALLPHVHYLTPAPPALSAVAAPTVLVTRCDLPRLSPGVQHIHLSSLTPTDGVDLFERVLGRPLTGNDRRAALRIANAVGGVPLALEAAATLAQERIPLTVLAATAERNPLAILGSVGASDRTLARSLDALPDAIRTWLALLSVLQAESFGLDAAAALHPAESELAVAASSELIRHSLLEWERPVSSAVTTPRNTDAALGARLRLSPLVRAYAAEQAQALPFPVLEVARHGLAAYADDYIERHNDNIQALAAEAAVLRSALWHAVRDGEHERTLRLVRGLLLVALQRGTCRDIERLLVAGIRAGKVIADQHGQMALLNLLGAIRFYRGDKDGARRAWTQCIHLVDDAHAPDNYHGFAYLNLAQLADAENEPDAAWHLAELGVYYTKKAGIATALAGAFVAQAERARRRGKHRVAYAYARESLDLVMAPRIDQNLDQNSGSQHAYIVEARLALARIENDYAAASAYADQYLAFLTSTHCLFVAESVIDHAEYSLEVGLEQDAVRLAERALAVSSGAHASALSQRARALCRRTHHSNTASLWTVAGA
jgi:hypothetical protein